jgi:hypothetical protein
MEIRTYRLILPVSTSLAAHSLTSKYSKMTYLQLSILFLGLCLAGIVTMDYTQKNGAAGNGFGGSRPFQSVFSLLASYIIIGAMVCAGWLAFDEGPTLNPPDNLTDQTRPTNTAPPVAAPNPVVAPYRQQEEARVVPTAPPLVVPPVQTPAPPPTVLRPTPQPAPTTYALPPPGETSGLTAEPLRGRNHTGPTVFYIIPEGAVSNPDKMLARMYGDTKFHLSFRLYNSHLFKVGYGPFKSWADAEHYRRELGVKNVPLPYRWR